MGEADENESVMGKIDGSRMGVSDEGGGGSITNELEGVPRLCGLLEALARKGVDALLNDRCFC